MGDARLVGRLNKHLQSYLYGGRGPARWLAAMSRATEPLWALATADRPLLVLAVPPPLAEAGSLTAILGPLTATSHPTDEVGDGEEPGPHPGAASVEPAGALQGSVSLTSRATMPVKDYELGRLPVAGNDGRSGQRPTAASAGPAGVPRSATGLPSRFPTAVKGPGARARESAAWPPLPAARTQFTQAELQSLADEPRVAALLDDASRPRRQGPELLRDQGGLPSLQVDVPPANTATTTLIEVLGQRLPGQTRLASQAPDRETRRRSPSVRPNRINLTSTGDLTAYINQTLPALVRHGFARPVNGAAAPRRLLLRLAQEKTAVQVESAAIAGNLASSAPASPSPGKVTKPTGAVLDAPGSANREQPSGGLVTASTSEIWPGPTLGPPAAATVLQTLVNAWSQSRRPDVALSMAEAVPPETAALTETETSPAVQNTFNVTVHTAGGAEDETELAERIARILADQARRHGIDVT